VRKAKSPITFKKGIKFDQLTRGMSHFWVVLLFVLIQPMHESIPLTSEPASFVMILSDRSNNLKPRLFNPRPPNLPADNTTLRIFLFSLFLFSPNSKKTMFRRWLKTQAYKQPVD
jgi:uncharacterized protein YhhL (DUF1145 family)